MTSRCKKWKNVDYIVENDNMYAVRKELLKVEPEQMDMNALIVPQNSLRVRKYCL